MRTVLWALLGVAVLVIVVVIAGLVWWVRVYVRSNR